VHVSFLNFRGNELKLIIIKFVGKVSAFFGLFFLHHFIVLVFILNFGIINQFVQRVNSYDSFFAVTIFLFDMNGRRVFINITFDKFLSICLSFSFGLFDDYLDGKEYFGG
jgi:hypothetical protein